MNRQTGRPAMSRRRMLASTAAAAGIALLPADAAHASKQKLTPEEEAFLDELERQACLLFWEQASPATGQVLDRARNDLGGARDPRRMASIAATGFGLTALCIADSRDYMPRAQIVERVRTTLDYHLNKLPEVHGFFYHFNDIETGERIGRCELSSIDTSLLLCGVLTARAYFHDPKIQSMARQIYERVDWPWMLNGGKTFSMGWKPESGFLAARWEHYCELMMIYLLSIGSLTHPVTPEYWSNFSQHQRPAVAGQGKPNLVDVRGAPNVLAAADDRAVAHAFDDHAPRALDAVMAVVIDPLLAEHLAAEPALPAFLIAVAAILRVRLSRRNVERVSGGPHPDDGPARIEILDDVPHLVVRQVAVAGGDDHQVGRPEGLQPGDVVGRDRADRPVFRIDGEQDGTLEPMTGGEDLAQLRQGLFAAIFLVAGDQDDLFALAGAFAAFVNDPRVRRARPRPPRAGPRKVPRAPRRMRLPFWPLQVPPLFLFACRIPVLPAAPAEAEARRRNIQ